MCSVFASALEQEITAVQSGLLDPGGQRLPGLGGEFELNRLLRFLLQDHGALKDLRTMCDVTYLEFHQITTAQFAIDGQIEHGKVTGLVRHLESGADGPDLLEFQGWLLADQFALVPGGMFLRGMR